MKKAKLINELKQLPGGLVLGGDGRTEDILCIFSALICIMGQIDPCSTLNPRHSAKYGCYFLMELWMNRVVDVKLVQVFSSAPI